MTESKKWGVVILFSAIVGFLIVFNNVSRIESQERAKEEKGEKDWGFYQIYWNTKQFKKDLSVQIKQFGGRPKYILFFRDLHPRRQFPLQAVEICRANKLTPIISLELWNWSENRKGDYLNKINLGIYDDFFTKWAQSAKLFRDPIILRFGFEMNGDWFSWGQKPKKFVKAWKHVFAIMKREEAKNVKWMFSPNILSGGQTPKKDLFPYFPGSQYVDFVGIDGYNFGDNHDKFHHWEVYHHIFEKTIQALNSLKKPIFLAEIGCADDPRKSLWIQDFLHRFSKDKRLKAFIYFNYNKSREKEPNWRIDSDKKTLQIFKKWVTFPPLP